MLVYQRVIPYLASMNIHKNPSNVGPGEASAATSPSSCSWQGAKFSAIASMVEWLIHVLCFPMLAVSGFLDCFVFLACGFCCVECGYVLVGGLEHWLFSIIYDMG